MGKSRNSIDNLKLELISWIISIDDNELLQKIYSLKEENNKRKFEFGKGTFTNVSDDFDDS